MNVQKMKTRVLRFLIFLFILGVLMEAASKWILLPYLKHATSRPEQMPKQVKLNPAGYDLIAIGDSFVQTGTDGWICLMEMKGWKVLNLGTGGACPSMYWQTFKEIEPQLKPDQLVLVLLYVGNDFTDETLWQKLKVKENYHAARAALYFRSNDLFWPYAHVDPPEVRTPWRSFRKQSATLKVLSILRYAIYLRLRIQTSSPPPSTMDRYMQVYKIHGLERQNQLLEEILNQNITQKQNVFRKKGRIFFLRHHDATAYDASEENKAVAAHILEMVRTLKNWRNVVIVPILDREEIGIRFHHQALRKNAPFVDLLKKVDSNVMDTNPLFENEFLMKNLYLPDGHWNLEEHKLFADALAKRFGDKRH